MIKHFLCGCHCLVAVLNCLDFSVFHSHDESAICSIHRFFVCATSFLFLFIVNDFAVTVVLCLCTKLTPVLRAIKYYCINSFREFGSDVASSKLAAPTGCTLECLFINDYEMKDNLAASQLLLL